MTQMIINLNNSSDIHHDDDSNSCLVMACTQRYKRYNRFLEVVKIKQETETLAAASLLQCSRDGHWLLCLHGYHAALSQSCRPWPAKPQHALHGL